MLAAAYAMAWAIDHYSVAPANLRLGPGGAIEGWLVAGPFPNAPDEEAKRFGLSTEWIGPESSAKPIEGQFITNLRDAGLPDFWRLATTDERHELDFGSTFGGKQPGVAYAFATLVSARSETIALEVNGADVLRVVLNGKKIFEGGKSGAASARLPVQLFEGPNRILVKAVHDEGSWKAQVRVIGRSEVFEQLAVYRTGEHSEPADLRAVRAIRGKRGALDLDAALNYDSTARYAAQWIDIFYKEAPHPGLLESIIGEAGRFVVTAEKGDADHISAALRRATDLIRVAFRQTRAQVLAAIQHPPSLLSTNVSKEDFAKVGPGKRYFAHANGKPLPVIGFTQRLTARELYACDPNNPAYRPELTDAYFARIADSGVNVVRIAVDSPELDPFDEATGKLSPEHLKWVDNIFLIALKQGLKLLICAYDSPRNDSKSGKNKLPGPAAQKRRWRAIIDRWGNSGIVFGWEILDEADQCGAAPSQAAAAIEDVAGFVRRYEEIKWGRNHLITSSTFAALPTGELANTTFHSKSLDFAETHLYVGASRAPLDAWSPAQDTMSASAHCLAMSRGRPYLDGENGPVDHPVADALSDSEIFANMAWAEIADGSAGVGLRRPYRSPDILTDQMLDTLSGIRVFALGVEWPKLAGAGTNELVASAPRRWISSGFGTPKAAILWAAGPVLGDKVVLGGKAPFRSGKFRVYDCAAKKWVGSGTFRDSLAIPDGLKSVAWVLSPS